MSVKIGSARIDENGHATGGKAGDQTGKEVSTQTWYKHSKGWRVFRAKDPDVAAKIAQDMEWACANKNIGYDQNQRLTLYNVAKPLGFNCKLVSTPCETDCSALVRVCCAYAGVMLPNFRTTTEASVLLNSGAFEEMKGKKYTDSSDYLRRGDILVTRTQGHTVVVLTNGPKAEVGPVIYKLGERTLQRGDTGNDVLELQNDLMQLGWSFPRYGADGDFGAETETNVKGFQRDVGLEPTGVFDHASYEALMARMARYVEIMGANVNVRSGPGTQYAILGVVHKGDRLPYGGKTLDNGWYLVEYGGGNGAVSPKYGRLIE